MRYAAREPDERGHIEREGVSVFFEVFGSGETTILFCPTWTLVPSQVWKMQVPYLAEHFRVIAFDPRGNGQSDRPGVLDAYAESEFAKDALAVLDATHTERAIVVGLSRGTQRTLLLAAEHPQRVLGLVIIGPWFPVSWSLRSVLFRITSRSLGARLFMRPPLLARSWGKVNGVHYRRDFSDFVEWFAARATDEAHSTKGFDDVVEWSLGTDPETMIHVTLAEAATPVTRRAQLALARRVQCPVLAIGGTADKVTPFADAKLLAKATNGKLLRMEGGSHVPEGRRPVEVNLAIREHADPSFRRSPHRWAPPRAVRLLADRPRTRAPRCRDRPRAARARAGPADRLARAGPGHPSARGGGRAHPPGQRTPGQRDAPLGAGGMRARVALLQRAAADGRDPGGELHDLRRRCARDAL
ncbi:MAG TPA: alpha/beta hydrolase [Solirubrobacterales bacterium]|nr:alpha/beta hydrolase [Solirubrobacterales bacterium]